MNQQRMLAIFAAAKQCAKTLKKYGSIHANKLPRITVEEDKWLRANGAKHWIHCTRTVDYDEDVWKDDLSCGEVIDRKGRKFLTSRPSRSADPIVREIWFGARSLQALDSKEDLEKEDMAEASDPLFFLYYDPEHNCMMTDDPETGEYRPVQVGDVLTMARGSNDDLDELFGDEPTDDRSENDALLRELSRDQVRANTYLEDSFNADLGMRKHPGVGLKGTMVVNGLVVELDDYYRRVEKRGGYAVPSDVLIENEVDQRTPDSVLWQRACAFAERKLGVGHAHIADLARQVMAKFKEEEAGVKYNHEGEQISGYYAERSEYYANLEANLRRTEAELRKRKAAPAPVDWKAVRKGKRR